MSAEKVVEKILADAKTQAEKIKAEAEGKVKQAAEKTAAQLADFDKETAELEKKAFEEAKSRVLATARMDIAKQSLRTRKGLIDEVFVRASDEIKNMNDADYVQLMKKLLLACVETGDEEIVTGKKETRLGADFLSDVNSQLGDKGNLTLARDKADIEAGFILSRGKVRMNVSLEVLLGQIREELETEIAKELFS
ncbi:MAG: hypothetical protein GWO86_03665 [Planctomycetes bacterium]|nr:hypothetical protein [Planctomycetota bacterium]